MEIKKIINFCKKRGALYLFDGDGCQLRIQIFDT